MRAGSSRGLVPGVLLALAALGGPSCGPAPRCSNGSKVGGVDVKLDGVPFFAGEGVCAEATSSTLVITLRESDLLTVSLGFSKTGPTTCEGDDDHAQIDSTGFKADGFDPAYAAGSTRVGTSCSLSWSGVPASGRGTGTFTGRLSRTNQLGTATQYADVSFGFSIPAP